MENYVNEHKHRVILMLHSGSKFPEITTQLEIVGKVCDEFQTRWHWVLVRSQFFSLCAMFVQGQHDVTMRCSRRANMKSLHELFETQHNCGEREECRGITLRACLGHFRRNIFSMKLLGFSRKVTRQKETREFDLITSLETVTKSTIRASRAEIFQFN
jgi:hypothetical protein